MKKIRSIFMKIANYSFAILIAIALLLFAKQLVTNKTLPSFGGRGKAGGAPGEVTVPADERGRGPILVKAFKVARVPEFEDRLTVMGSVTGTKSIGLKFEMTGVINNIAVREGDIVEKGDLLIELDPRDAELKVAYAQARADAAQAALEGSDQKVKMHEDLFRIGAIVETKLQEVKKDREVAQKQYEVSKVELDSAKEDFKKTALYAPRSGVIIAREREEGELVSMQDIVLKLMEIDSVYIEMGIIEKDINKITLGQDVTITVDTYQGEVFTGTIEAITPALEGKTRTLTIKALVPNDDNKLLPGMFARCSVGVYWVDHAIVIPSVCLNLEEEEATVFVVNEDNTVISRPVEVGYLTTDFAHILNGLTEDELIVVDAQEELKDGQTVEVAEIQESAF